MLPATEVNVIRGSGTDLGRLPELLVDTIHLIADQTQDLLYCRVDDPFQLLTTGQVRQARLWLAEEPEQERQEKKYLTW
jgi:hypothetical protein